jgi:hypothetical protein
MGKVSRADRNWNEETAMKTVLALCLIAGAAGPAAAAEDVFRRPESCVPVATAQHGGARNRYSTPAVGEPILCFRTLTGTEFTA